MHVTETYSCAINEEETRMDSLTCRDITSATNLQNDNYPVKITILNRKH